MVKKSIFLGKNGLKLIVKSVFFFTNCMIYFLEKFEEFKKEIQKKIKKERKKMIFS